MTLRNVLLLFHIAGVSAWLGANFVQFALTPWFARRETPVTVAWVEATRMLGQRYYNAAGVVIGVTGVSMVLHLDYSFGSGFVVLGITTLVVGGLVGVFGFDRLASRHLDALHSGDAQGASRLRARTLWTAVFDTTLVLVTILAMVNRWLA